MGILIVSAPGLLRPGRPLKTGEVSGNEHVQ
jgi:hypothetical protein